MNYAFLLRPLNEIQGVLGSFVCDQDGRLLVREAPTMFRDEILSAIGRRMPRFFAAGDKTLRTTEAIFLKFSVCQVIGVRLSSGSLNILCQDFVHLPSLRIAASMVAQQIDREGASSIPKNFMPIPERIA